MDIWKIIKSELSHKKVGFVMGVISLVVATAGFVGTFILLKGDELAIEQVFVEKEKEMRCEMLRLEDD